MASTLVLPTPIVHHLGHVEVPRTSPPKHATSPVAPVDVRLDQLNSEVSFSKFLSPRGTSGSIRITNDGDLLDSVHLINLALNEECRRLRKGCFYHVPLRQDQTKGHPCDLVFVDEDWGPTSIRTWDQTNWKERLEMCNARKPKLPLTTVPLTFRSLSPHSQENEAS